MSSDASMLSDDDRPLRAKPGPSHTNGNGHIGMNGNGGADRSSSLSDDDEIPLVRSIDHVSLRV